MKSCLLLAVFWLLCDAAAAHKASDSYLTLGRDKVDAQALVGRWDIALRDLDAAITLDANGDGEITWGEVLDAQDRIADYAMSRLSVRAGTLACPIKVTEQLIDRHSDGSYAVLLLAGRCPRASTALTVDYRLLFDIDPQHRGLLQFADGGVARSVIFSVDTPSQRVGGEAVGRFGQFTQYVRDGVWHIWRGFDHVLFLVSLLLPAVLRRQGGSWIPAPDFRGALIDVLRTVTAFTVAHSITLSLATVGVVSPDSRWVEATIALSVVLAAFNNMVPVVDDGRWAVAFGFGLIHGLGFASALKDLGLPTGSLVLSLFGFNAGVELGQLVLVGLILPMTFGLRRTRTYRSGMMIAGSGAIALIAAMWFVERAFNMSLTGRLFVG